MKVSMKAMRVNANLSQKDAAKAIGINKRTLQKWESNETFPKVTQLKQLCDIYGCKIEDIFLPDVLAESE